MFFWVLQRIILSLVFIAIIHYTYVFFKENLTIPKVKDLVNKPTQQYDAIYKSMSKGDTDTKNMKQELQKYFNELSTDKKKATVTKPDEFSFTTNHSTLQYQSV